MALGKSPLSNGIAAIRLMVQSGHSWGVTALAKELGMPKSSIHRLLQSLIELGFVQKIEQTKRYTVSADIFEFIHEIATHFGKNRSLGECLWEAARTLECSVYLNMLGHQCSYVICAAGEEGSTSKLGLHAKSYESSAGKVLIAQMDEAEWPRYAPPNDAENPSQKNPQSERFYGQLREARDKRVAWNLRESSPNYVSLAAVVREPFITQPRLAVALLLRYEELRLRDPDELEQAVLVLADELEHILGLH
ncbi:IclR family transcriptional regulator [Cerasicoccus arenae]|nr:helix-turn-helix domain-containing protein [Cerasicoccus arenae]MBK1859254.1 helix-turn-helix domain-containing protein [Cerasicoccus arenae]